jgi:hypothetical protein
VPVIAWHPHGDLVVAMVARTDGTLARVDKCAGFVGVWVPPRDRRTLPQFGEDFRKQWELQPGGKIRHSSTAPKAP